MEEVTTLRDDEKVSVKKYIFEYGVEVYEVYNKKTKEYENFDTRKEAYSCVMTEKI